MGEMGLKKTLTGKNRSPRGKAALEKRANTGEEETQKRGEGEIRVEAKRGLACWDPIGGEMKKDRKKVLYF